MSFTLDRTRLPNELSRARILADWKSDPTEQVLKVLDTSDKEIISYGKWNVYTRQRPPSEWDQHMEVDWTTDPALREGAETYIREIHGMRHRYATGQPHLCQSAEPKENPGANLKSRMQC